MADKCSSFDFSELDITEDEWDSLHPWDQNELMQNWAIGAEVTSDFEHNPIYEARAKLQYEQGFPGWREEFLHYPSIDHLTDTSERGETIDNAIMEGHRCTLHTDDFGDVVGEAWLPNFRVPG